MAKMATYVPTDPKVMTVKKSGATQLMFLDVGWKIQPAPQNGERSKLILQKGVRYYQR